jgi:hypothetical protein
MNCKRCSSSDPRGEKTRDRLSLMRSIIRIVQTEYRGLAKCGSPLAKRLVLV